LQRQCQISRAFVGQLDERGDIGGGASGVKEQQAIAGRGSAVRAWTGFATEPRALQKKRLGKPQGSKNPCLRTGGGVLKASIFFNHIGGKSIKKSIRDRDAKKKLRVRTQNRIRNKFRLAGCQWGKKRVGGKVTGRQSTLREAHTKMFHKVLKALHGQNSSKNTPCNYQKRRSFLELKNNYGRRHTEERTCNSDKRSWSNLEFHISIVSETLLLRNSTVQPA